MWLRGDVDEKKEYQVALCQRLDGKRYYSLHSSGQLNLPADTVFLTEVVPTNLLLSRYFAGISEVVPLKGGKRFFVEAHGVWFTEEEWKALDRDVNWHDVEWLNGLAPILPPK
jgi:8-oxo-dGTP pyrophosphatase MutT (NUDIX family)